MNRTVYWIEKTIYLGVALIAAVFFLSLFKIWSIDQNRYFFFVGDWESILLVAVVTTGFTVILERLWKWEVREVFKPRKRRH